MMTQFGLDETRHLPRYGIRDHITGRYRPTKDKIHILNFQYYLYLKTQLFKLSLNN